MSDTEPAPRPLDELLKAIGSGGVGAGLSVTGITDDSRDVDPGALFVAVPGALADGHDFVGEAAGRGAVAIVAEHELEGTALPVIRVPDARRALADLAAAWYGHPEREITMIGITGSLGKTSVLTMLEAILTEADVGFGAIGSEIVGIRVHDHFDVKTPNTTPGPITLHRGLRRMADEGVHVAAIEVTSHALDQQRIHGVNFAAGIFTNLVPLEHQDYHGSFEEYVRTKLSFCDHLRPGAPLTHGIDSDRLTEALHGRDLNLVGCGFAPPADIRITEYHTTRAGTAYTLRVGDRQRRIDGSRYEHDSVSVRLRLLGRPHVLNSAFAAAAALHLGVDGNVVARALAAVEPPTRRMELVEVGDIHVLDDTAGHPSSIDAVFDVVSQLTYRRLIVVAAIRGKRGPHINARLSSAIGRHCSEQRADVLVITDSSDTVAEADRVSSDERKAFMAGLEHSGAPFVHTGTLNDALDLALRATGPDDLVVLVGAQGMREGVGRLTALLGPPAAASRR